jgi:hypothetical protein
MTSSIQEDTLGVPPTVLIAAYKHVQDGIIQDPETIHALAYKCEDLAKDPKEAAPVPFDLDQAAQNLHMHATMLESLDNDGREVNANK